MFKDISISLIIGDVGPNIQMFRTSNKLKPFGAVLSIKSRCARTFEGVVKTCSTILTIPKQVISKEL